MSKVESRPILLEKGTESLAGTAVFRWRLTSAFSATSPIAGVTCVQAECELCQRTRPRINVLRSRPSQTHAQPPFAESLELQKLLCRHVLCSPSARGAHVAGDVPVDAPGGRRAGVNWEMGTDHTHYCVRD
ncbi:unnamed protein product, partial [Rangifer tarandus platyrhynchus]|uniref:Uncharacterized protein n=1 Tax=Rangifer tarandus platyrhynchus TaxID=3082113 RepID=A0AC59YB61_RANTA